MVDKAAKSFPLHGRDPRHHLDLSGDRVHYGTAGAAVNVVDLATNAYRPSTAPDLYDAARLAQHLDNIHFFQRTMVCCEIADLVEMDLNTLYACLAGTTKHVGTSFSDPASVDPAHGDDPHGGGR
jgi:trimethylamine--corrinoid protein Co-methyltransferase